MKSTYDRIQKFTEERNWDQFHSPANLAKSIVLEAAELLENFQWDDNTYDLRSVQEELADVMIYSIQMAQKLNLDIETIINDKIDNNEKKYPVALAKDSSKKYSELGE